jgi:hypothetical protein
VSKGREINKPSTLPLLPCPYNLPIPPEATLPQYLKLLPRRHSNDKTLNLRPRLVTKRKNTLEDGSDAATLCADGTPDPLNVVMVRSTSMVLVKAFAKSVTSLTLMA